MKGRGLLTGLVVGGLLLPGTVLAQDRAELRLAPHAGLLTPANWFYVEFTQFGVQPMEWTEAAIQRAGVAGLSAEVAFERVGIRVRVEGLRTLGAETLLDHAVLVPASEANPAAVVRTRYRVPTTLTIGTVDLALPLRLRLPAGLEPYVTAGAGGKRYAFDTGVIPTTPNRVVLPNDGTVAVVNLGAGATLRRGRMGLDLLVRDALSAYWGEQQHDVAFLAGLTVRLH